MLAGREQLVAHMREALPEEEQEAASSVARSFSNIFSDHLPVFVDVEMGVERGEQEVAAGEVKREVEHAEASPSEATVSEATLTCKRCAAGKGCRWRGRQGHAAASKANEPTVTVRDDVEIA